MAESFHWRMQLNNYLQSNGGPRILTWDVYQSGPLHQPMWTAIAYRESSTAGAQARARALSRRKQRDRHSLPSIEIEASEASHEQFDTEPFTFALLSTLSSLFMPRFKITPDHVA